jgi:hypothetical protein
MPRKVTTLSRRIFANARIDLVDHNLAFGHRLGKPGASPAPGDEPATGGCGWVPRRPAPHGEPPSPEGSAELLYCAIGIFVGGRRISRLTLCGIATSVSPHRRSK